MDPSATRHILVVRPGALGDVLLTLPVFEALRRAFPVAHITWAGTGELLRLLPGRSALDDAISFDSAEWVPLFLEGEEPGAGLRAWLGKQDLVLCYGGMQEGALAGNLRRLTSGAFVYVDARPQASRGVHMSEYLQQCLTTVGVGLSGEPGKLRLTEADRRSAREWRSVHGQTRPLAIIHSGSGSAAKNWPAERFVALASWLEEDVACRVVWLQGPADQAVAQTVHRLMGSVPSTWLQQASLNLLAGLLESCALYVGNDSGVSHLAAAVGAPSVVIFGATDDRVWAPRDHRVVVLTPQDGVLSGGEVDPLGSAAVRNVVWADVATVQEACRAVFVRM
jgi:heptosyltransferase III